MAQRVPCLPKNTTPATISTAARWQAVVTRDKTVTSFVYAVLTTKIYCRPSCPARLARRANVDFYDTPSQAERAGFRPCKRCNPEMLKPAINPQVLLVQEACQTIKEDIAAGVKPTLSKLSAQAGQTPSHFHRVFKRIMGVTPGKYTAGVLRENEAGSGRPLDGSGLLDGDVRGLGVFQPGQAQRNEMLLCAGFDSWLMREPDLRGDLTAVGAAAAAGVLWNDFDILIAAEAEFTSRAQQDLSLRAGRLGEFGSDSTSSTPRVDGDPGFSFGGV
ncbi:metal binding domain of Ada-domain-containing protein [Aspergillus egyptiacus]|nr:metal binding domain of Ada-domain-containing protein [Aspergillus egyptiacus]